MYFVFSGRGRGHCRQYWNASFQRDFHRRRAVAGKEHVLQIARCEVGQPLGQPHRRVTTHAQRRAVGHAVKLLAHGRIDPRVPVAVHVAPHAARAVEIRAAVDIEQPAAFGPLDHERLVLGHLREGVPEVAAVPIEKLVRGSVARSLTEWSTS